MEYKFSVSAANEPGNGDRKGQDRYYYDESRGLFVVADGCESLGDRAADILIDSLKRVPVTSLGVETAQSLILRDLAQRFGAQIKGLTKEGILVQYDLFSLTESMGVSFAALDFGVRKALWSGDVRVYRVNDKTLNRLTLDHSPRGKAYGRRETREMPDSYFVHPERNLLTSCLGGLDTAIYGDVLAAPYVSEPFEFIVGDKFLIMSDGVYGVFESKFRHGADEEMVESLDLGGVEGLVNDAFRMVDGYRDDMTALLVEVEGIDI